MPDMLPPRAPLHGLDRPQRHGALSEPPGVTLRVLDPAAASVTVFKHSAARAITALGEEMGVVVPLNPAMAAHGENRLVWSGPRSWLALSLDAAPGALSARLAARLGADAAIVELSDGRVFIRVAGAKAEAALQKEIPLDLHPSAFAPGAAASTRMAHLPVQLWRHGDGFEICTPTSYARDLWRTLLFCSEGFGAAVLGA